MSGRWQRWRWRWNRLRLMGPAEWLHRGAQAVHTAAQARGWGLALQPPAPMPPGELPRLFAAVPAGLNAQALQTYADALLAGRWRLFGQADAELGFPPDWHRDPSTGVRAPLRFGKQINFRDATQVGVIKTLWEPSRQLELVTLAQAWRVGADARHLEGCRRLLDDWLGANPYPLGVHWSSSLELAIRLLNWAVAWELLGGWRGALFDGAEGEGLRRRWLDAIYQHQHFIDGHRSLHSSANNHLLGELLALFVAGHVWPCWPQRSGQAARARRELSAQMLLQNAPDGSNREQAIYYHHEVADMLLLFALWARCFGEPLPQQLLERLEAMLDFIRSCRDRQGQVPAFGDADDAVMLRLDPSPDFCPYQSLLASGALLFDRADFAQAAGACDDKTRWLMGADGLQGRTRATPRRQHFPDAGLALLGQDFGGPKEVCAWLDHGPLGYLSIAAHGHADALSLCLHAGGQALLVDPGTFSYQSGAEPFDSSWRAHFRSTAAHNTVCIDGRNQSEIGGDFMWLAKAQSTLEALELDAPVQLWRARHDGYERLAAGGVTHRRTVRFDAQALTLEVLDELLGRGEHEAMLSWQLAPGLQPELQGQRALVKARGLLLRLEADGAAPLQVMCGSEQAPRAGWVSPRFGERVAAVQLRQTLRFSGSLRLRSLFSLRFD